MSGSKRLGRLGLRREMPTALRERLLSTPESEGSSPEALGQRALPPQLRARLLDIPRREAGRKLPPRSIRSPYSAVVASYLLAVLSFLTIGDPVARAAQATSAVRGEVGSWTGRVDHGARDVLADVELTMAEGWLDTRERIDESVAAVRSTATKILERAWALLPGSDDNRPSSEDSPVEQQEK